MLRYLLPDKRMCNTRQRSKLFTGFRASLLLLALVMVSAPALQAGGAGAQRAIEKLERCSANERPKGCVKILKRKPLGNGRHAIKAQVRGGRIIWYEYDPTTGKVRRTN